MCISDTHNNAHKMIHQIPGGDVLLHAGDFTLSGKLEEVNKFSEFLGTLNDRFKYKVVINGNHEMSFDENCTNPRRPKDIKQNPRELLKNCTYLEDSSVEVYGIKVYGSPW